MRDNRAGRQSPDAPVSTKDLLLWLGLFAAFFIAIGWLAWLSAWTHPDAPIWDDWNGRCVENTPPIVRWGDRWLGKVSPDEDLDDDCKPDGNRIGSAGKEEMRRDLRKRFESFCEGPAWKHNRWRKAAGCEDLDRMVEAALSGGAPETEPELPDSRDFSRPIILGRQP